MHLRWRFFKCSFFLFVIEIKSKHIMLNIINLGHLCSFKNDYICTKQTDQSYHNRRHQCSRI